MYGRLFIALVATSVIITTGCIETRMTQIPDNAIIIDTQSRSGYEKNHLACATSLPWYDIDRRRAKTVLSDKTRPVVVYDLTGDRIEAEKKQLEALGYESVYDGGSMYSLRRLIEEKQPGSVCSTFRKGL